MNKAGVNNQNNLEHLAPELYFFIVNFHISKTYFASRFYKEVKNFDKLKPEEKQVLTVRLRNKLNGSGSISPSELVEIQNIVLDIADKAREAVALTNKRIERKNKIAKFLDNINELDPRDVKKLDDIIGTVNL